jgi:A/G-specific adenine glycosylase
MKKQPVDAEDVSDLKRGQAFVKELLRWNRYDNGRQMPWKNEKNPYKIWLSEVILQQTRVEQGLSYYRNFIEAFPDIHKLAAAPDEKVFKLWEGLGYYSRCRNLLYTARYIVNELGGVFPQTYEGILALKGVGPYTAAAIGSFAFNLPYAVLDGNVYRVLARVFNKEVPIDSTAGKKLFSTLAQRLLPAEEAGTYNQAIMDFGATVCKPQPNCTGCFFNKGCLAYLAGKQQLLPVKEVRLTRKKRWLNYFLVQHADEILIRQRSAKDVWQGLHEFFLIETPYAYPPKQMLAMFTQQAGISEFQMEAEWEKKQTLSHQTISFHFFHCTVNQRKKVDGYHWIGPAERNRLAFPRTLQTALSLLYTSKVR